MRPTNTITPPSGSTGNTVSNRTRLGFIDDARAIAIILAMTSHAMVHFDLWRSIEFPLRVFTRMATPTFIVLFGVMIGSVYIKKWQQGNQLDVTTRLISRAMTCYILFFFITIAALIGQHIDAFETIRALFFIQSGRFGNILKIYSILLVIMIPVIHIYSKIQTSQQYIIFSFILLNLVWGIRYFGRIFEVDDRGHILSFLFGIPIGFGPALTLSITFVIFGMGIGLFIRSKITYTLYFSIFMIFSSIIIISMNTAENGVSKFIELISSYFFRGDNNPAYFAFGIIGATIIIIFASLISFYFKIPLIFRCIGSRSIFIYSIGNILLNLMPNFDSVSIEGRIGIAFGFIIAIIASNYIYHLLDLEFESRRLSGRRMGIVWFPMKVVERWTVFSRVIGRRIASMSVVARRPGA